MNDSPELRKQQYQRMMELSQIARQHYLNAGGDPRHSSGTLHGNNRLTEDEEERQEFFTLGQ